MLLTWGPTHRGPCILTDHLLDAATDAMGTDDNYRHVSSGT